MAIYICQNYAGIISTSLQLRVMQLRQVAIAYSIASSYSYKAEVHPIFNGRLGL